MAPLLQKIKDQSNSGADPAFGQEGGCKNNGTPTFAAAIANISDHVHAPKQAGPTEASMNRPLSRKRHCCARNR